MPDTWNIFDRFAPSMAPMELAIPDEFDQIYNNCPGDHLSSRKISYFAASWLAIFTFFYDISDVYCILQRYARVDYDLALRDLVPHMIRLGVLIYLSIVMWLFCRCQRRIRLSYLQVQAHIYDLRDWRLDCTMRHAKYVNQTPFGTIRQFIWGHSLVYMLRIWQWYNTFGRIVRPWEDPIDNWDWDHKYTWEHGEISDVPTKNRTYYEKKEWQHLIALMNRPSRPLKRIDRANS
ncbi:hypothetical protein IAT40_003542 [Kwoniella sp. CBS 6097]